MIEDLQKCVKGHKEEQLNRKSKARIKIFVRTVLVFGDN